MKQDFVVETSATLKRLSQLFSVPFRITDKENIFEVYYFSVITEILIHLNDLGQKLIKLNNAISFNAELTNENNYVDISALINNFRNAACHNDSARRRTKSGNLFANNVFVAYDYPDEITILMGDSKLFVKRHIVRFYKNVLRNFMTYSEFQNNNNFKDAITIAKISGYID